MSSRGHISGSLLKTVVDVAEMTGVCRSDLLASMELCDEQLESSGFRLPAQATIELLKDVIARSGDQGFGLLVGREVKPGSLNSLGYALMSAKNLDEALKIQKAFGGIISDCAELKVSFKGDFIVVSFTVESDDLEAVRPLNDMFMSTIWNYSNWITRTDGKLHAITFTHPEPSYKEAYTEIFGLVPEFGQDACSFVFDKKFLEDPLYQADASLNALMQERSQTERDKTKSSVSVYAAVAYQVRKLLPVQKATLILVAEQLNMSEQTLRRKLGSEGISYQQIKDNLRHDLANKLLNNRHISIAQISKQLNYSEPRAFSRAYKQWSGQTPQLYRSQRKVRNK